MNMRYGLALAGILLCIACAPVAARAASASTSSTTPGYLNAATPVQPANAYVARIEAWSPRVGAVVAPVCSAIDRARVYAAALLTRHSASVGRHLPGTAVLKPQTISDVQKSVSLAGAWQAALSVLITMYFYILVVVRYLIANAATCYALILGGVLLTAVLLIRRWRR
jgi:hypothetical protein